MSKNMEDKYLMMEDGPCEDESWWELQESAGVMGATWTNIPQIKTKITS